VRGQRSVDWRLVDAVVRTQDFAAKVQDRAQTLARTSDRPETAVGITLTPIERTLHENGIRYRHVNVDLDRDRRTATSP
jgi:benzoyl-CoA-dihydrodiol lyase